MIIKFMILLYFKLISFLDTPIDTPKIQLWPQNPRPSGYEGYPCIRNNFLISICYMTSQVATSASCRTEQPRTDGKKLHHSFWVRVPAKAAAGKLPDVFFLTIVNLEVLGVLILDC